MENNRVLFSMSNKVEEGSHDLLWLSLRPETSFGRRVCIMKKYDANMVPVSHQVGWYKTSAYATPAYVGEITGKDFNKKFNPVIPVSDTGTIKLYRA